MATSAYGVNHPVAVKIWSKKTFREALKQTWMAKFIGEDSNAMVMRVDDQKKGPGDRTTVHLRTQLTGQGVQGDGTLEGEWLPAY